MTTNQLIERTRKGLAEFRALPPDEQVRRMVTYGTINEQGEVLMGLEEAKRAMAYSDYNLPAVLQAFNLTIAQAPLFGDLVPVTPAAWLVELLQRGRPLALFSEKSRCEFIVAPLLLYCRELAGESCFIYSGVRLDVDDEHGLKGECDFLIARTPPTPTLRPPLLVVLEAKKNDIAEGLGQCVAQMLGAQLYNKQHNQAERPVYGCVTTGETWQFLRLTGRDVLVDSERYYVTNAGTILAALLRIVS